MWFLWKIIDRLIQHYPRKRKNLLLEVLSKRSDFFRLFHFHGLKSLPMTASRFFLAGLVELEPRVDVSL